LQTLRQVLGQVPDETFNQMIGRLEEAQKVILNLGTKRFDQPRFAILTGILEIVDIDRLEHMLYRVLDATDWDDLLATS